MTALQIIVLFLPQVPKKKKKLHTVGGCISDTPDLSVGTAPQMQRACCRNIGSTGVTSTIDPARTINSKGADAKSRDCRYPPIRMNVLDPT